MLLKALVFCDLMRQVNERNKLTQCVNHNPWWRRYKMNYPPKEERREGGEKSLQGWGTEPETLCMLGYRRQRCLMQQVRLTLPVDRLGQLHNHHVVFWT